MVAGWTTAPAASDPMAEVFADLGSRLDPAWFLLALLVPAAVVVLWFGHRQLRSLRSSDFLEPSGRPLLEDDRPPPEAFRRTVLRLEREEPTPIAKARTGPVRIRGRIVSATSTFGPPDGPSCVYRNLEGAPPRAAVAAEALVVADATGKCGVEGLGRARVRAPSEPVRRGRSGVALYVGDVVEAFGTFARDPIEAPDDPTQTVYGTLGARGPLEIRVVDRPRPAGSPGPEPSSTEE